MGGGGGLASTVAGHAGQATLGPDNGDVYMEEVAGGGCKMIPKVEEGMEMVEEYNTYRSGWRLSLQSWRWT